MKNKTHQESYKEAICFGIFIGLCIMGIVTIFIGVSMDNDIIELGSAICEMEYDAEFDIYDSNGLHCKNNKIEQYDGLTIYVGVD